MAVISLIFLSRFHNKLYLHTQIFQKIYIARCSNLFTASLWGKSNEIETKSFLDFLVNKGPFIYKLSGCGFRSPVAVTYTSDITGFLSKEFLDIQATRLLSKHFCLQLFFPKDLSFFTVCTKMHFWHFFGFKAYIVHHW